MSLHDADVLVVGAGIVGLSAAIAMRQRGYSVMCWDKGTIEIDPLDSDPRVYAINDASKACFEVLGVWTALTRTTPVRGMLVWDAMTKASVDFDARMIGAHHLNHMVESVIMNNALVQKAMDCGVVLCAHHPLLTVTPTEDGVWVEGIHGQQHVGLLMVADGARSKTRGLLGVQSTEWSYHQESIVALIQTEKPHQSIARQVFTNGGVLALLPMMDDHLCSMVWSTTQEQFNVVQSMSDDVFGKHLTQTFEARLGESRLMSSRQSFPLMMRHVHAYAGTRWLLLGDAAHTIHPLAGLGLNTGLADLMTWLDLMDTKPGLLFSTSMLGAYQRRRKAAMWNIIAMMEVLKAGFTNTNPSLMALRALGMRGCNQWPWIKRWLIQQASGLSIKEYY